MSTILIVDDEPQIRRFLRISLGSQAYRTLEAESGKQAIERTAMESPGLVILDLGLPDMDGKDVLKALREFYSGPVIVLSVRYEESEKVTAIDAGANDYVVKPFGVKELLARIRSLMKLFEGVALHQPTFNDGHLSIDFSLREVALDGAPVRLSPKEFSLLQLLVTHPGRILTHQFLLGEIWGTDHREDTHYLRILVGKLRAKLADDPESPRYIQTESGVGYRLVGSET